jgi:SAM-dependent methyltransferase
MWPRIPFDPIQLFDLGIHDLLIHDPYFVRMAARTSYRRLGNDLFIGLLNAPDVVGYLCELCPEMADHLRESIAEMRPQSVDHIREAEAEVIESSFPWNLGMAKSPEVYDALPWSFWNPSVIYDHVDLHGKAVLDVGAGTGQVTLRCAPYADLVWALEPVGRLRRYMERKMGAAGFTNVRTLDGILESIPLENASADAAILSNGSFGWNPEKELRELERVTKSDGTILMLGPCNYNDPVCQKIADSGYTQFDFEVPGDGLKPGFIKQL